MSDPFTWFWIGWLLLFVVIEGVALIRKERGDTLSEKVWAWFWLKGDKGKLQAWQVVLRVGFIGFWAWLSLHFIFGGSIV